MISIIYSICMNNLPDPFNLLPKSASKRYELKKTDVLFRQGEQVANLYFLISGEVTLSRYGLAGDEVIIHLAQPRETFAEAALFSKAYHCNAIATQDSELWKISKTAILKFAEGNPKFSMDLTARFARQIQQLRGQKELLAIRSATERVYIAINQGLLGHSIKQFASTIGLTHEVVYRALTELVKENRMIKKGRGHYSLPLDKSDTL